MNIFGQRHCRRHEWLFPLSEKCPYCEKEGIETKALPLAQDFFVVDEIAQAQGRTSE